MKETLNRCVICGKMITLAATYLLAEGPRSDVVRNVCRGCYIRRSREIRQAVTKEGEEGFLP
jgi:hypothetical protein